MEGLEFIRGVEIEQLKAQVEALRQSERNRIFAIIELYEDHIASPNECKLLREIKAEVLKREAELARREAAK